MRAPVRQEQVSASALSATATSIARAARSLLVTSAQVARSEDQIAGIAQCIDEQQIVARSMALLSCGMVLVRDDATGQPAAARFAVERPPQTPRACRYKTGSRIPAVVEVRARFFDHRGAGGDDDVVRRPPAVPVQVLLNLRKSTPRPSRSPRARLGEHEVWQVRSSSHRGDPLFALGRRVRRRADRRRLSRIQVEMRGRCGHHTRGGWCRSRREMTTCAGAGPPSAASRTAGRHHAGEVDGRDPPRPGGIARPGAMNAR